MANEERTQVQAAEAAEVTTQEAPVEQADGRPAEEVAMEQIMEENGGMDITENQDPDEIPEEVLGSDDSIPPDIQEEQEEGQQEGPGGQEPPARPQARVAARDIASRNMIPSATYAQSDVVTINRTKNTDTVNEDEISWHEIKDAYIRHKVLTGVLVSCERWNVHDAKHDVAIVDYKGYRVVIALENMNIPVGGNAVNMTQQAKIANSMIGCDIDFMVTYLDDKNHAVVGSRRRAMEKKINDFYFEPSSSGQPVIHVGSIVEARVVAVMKKVIRLEVFGAECYIQIFEMDAAWMADARTKYYVGDIVNVRIVEIVLDEGSRHVRIRVEGKSLCKKNNFTCVKQGKYLGTITNIVKGTYFLRLNTQKSGKNAIAHSCSDTILPYEGDRVQFVCTYMDEERDVAIGLISRVIRHTR